MGVSEVINNTSKPSVVYREWLSRLKSGETLPRGKFFRGKQPGMPINMDESRDAAPVAAAKEVKVAKKEKTPTAVKAKPVKAAAKAKPAAAAKPKAVQPATEQPAAEGEASFAVGQTVRWQWGKSVREAKIVAIEESRLQVVGNAEPYWINTKTVAERLVK